MDRGRPKNQISRNWMKPTPSHWARRVIPSIYFFSENGHSMQKISQSEYQVKHAKKVKVKVKVNANVSSMS
jgi:hypothetical protein